MKKRKRTSGKNCRYERKETGCPWAVWFLVFISVALVSGCRKEQEIFLETASGEETSEESGTEGARETEGGSEGETILVHVCGAVENPGVYELKGNSRIYEALEAAGGMTDGAAGDYLNMAEALTDGEKIVVPLLAELESGDVYGQDREHVSEEAGKASREDSLVNLNCADKETLMTLPGIGEAKAEAIIAYREEHGGFSDPGDIMLVPGIKEAAYEKLKDKITVG